MLNKSRSDRSPNVPNYAKGVKQSIKYTAGRMVQSQMPSLYNTISTNRDVTRNVTTFFRTDKPSIRKAIEYAKATPEFKYASSFLKNAKDDLRSGKFYNEEREADLENDLLKTMGFDTGSFDVSQLDDFGDSNPDYYGEEGSSNGSALKQALLMSEANQSTRNAALASSIAQSSFATAEYMTETNIAIANNNLAFQSKMHVESMSALNNLQALASNIVDFNIKVVQPFMQDSRSYYDDSLTELRSIKEYLHESTELQRGMYKSPGGFSTSRVTVDDIVSSDGVVNIKDYMKAVKSNVKNMSTLAGGGVGRADMQRMMMQAAASPWAFMSDLMVRGLLPNSMKKALNDLDKTVSGVFSSFILQMNKLKNNNMGKGGNRGILSFLGEALGIDATVSTRPDLSIYREQAQTIVTENKKLKAITEVIPMYLAKILAVQTGGDEMAYNYNTGRFTSVNTAKKIYQNRLDNLHGNSMDSTKNAMARGLSAYNITNEKDRKKMEENLDTFVRFLGKMGESYHPDKDSYSYLKGKGMKLDERDYKLMKAAFKAMSESEQMEVPKNQLAAISEIRRNMKLLNQELQDTGLASATFGDFDIDYSKMKGRGGKAKKSKPRSIVRLSETEERDINSVVNSHKDVIRKSTNSKDMSSLDAVSSKAEDLILKEMRKHKEFLELENSNNNKEQQQSFFKQFTNESDVWKRYDVFKNKLANILNNPASLISDAIHTVDKTIYKIMYGDNPDGGPQSIMARVFSNITEAGNKAMKWVDDKILFPIHDTLFGKEGWFNPENSEWAKDMKGFLPKGVAGALTGMVSSAVLPGGPLLGAFMGAGISFATHSEKIKEYLFGKMGEDGKRDDAGLIPPEWQSTFKEYFPHGVKGAGAGLIGSWFLPGGPIIGMMMGATMGVVSHSEKFKQWMWGDMDPETQKRRGGVAGQVRDFLNDEIFGPMKNYLKKSKDNVANWFKDAITGPLQAGKEPIKQAFTIMGDRMKDAWGKAMGELKGIINDVFQKNVGMPLREFVKEKITDPLKNMLSKVFGAIGKALGGIISAPVKGVLALSKAIIADEEERQGKKQSIMDSLAEQLSGKDKKSNIKSKFSQMRDKMKDTWAGMYAKAADITGAMASGFSSKDNPFFAAAKKKQQQEHTDEIKKQREADQAKRKEASALRQAASAAKPMKTSGHVAGSATTTVNADGTITTTPNAILQNNISSHTRDITADGTKKKPEDMASEKTLKRIESHAGLIKDEIVGQLNGVGWNLEYIKNILVDQYGTPSMMPDTLKRMRGNFKRRGLFSRIFGFVTKPIKSIGGFLMNLGKSGLGLIGKGLWNTIKMPFKLLGGVWDVTKGIASIGLNILKVSSTVVTESIKMLSSGVRAAIGGIGEVIKGFGKGVGNVLVGIGSAMKDVTITLFKTARQVIPAVIKGLVTFSSTLTKAAWTVGKTIAKIATAPIRLLGGAIKRKFDGSSGFSKNKMTVRVEGGTLDKVRLVERVRWVDGVGTASKPLFFSGPGDGGGSNGAGMHGGFFTGKFGKNNPDDKPPGGGGGGGGIKQFFRNLASAFYPHNVGGSESESGGRGGVWGWLANSVGRKAFALNGMGDAPGGQSFWGRFGARVTMFKDAIIPYKFKGKVLKEFKKDVEETKKVARLRQLQDKMKNINTPHDYNARVLELLYTQIEAILSLRPLPSAKDDDKTKLPAIPAIAGLPSVSGGAVPSIISSIINTISNVTNNGNSKDSSGSNSTSNNDVSGNGQGKGKGYNGGEKRKWRGSDFPLPIPRWFPKTRPEYPARPDVIPFEPRRPAEEPIYPGEPIPFPKREEPSISPERRRIDPAARRKVISLFPKEQQPLVEEIVSKIPQEQLEVMYKPLKVAAGGEGMEFRYLDANAEGGKYTIFNTEGGGKGNITEVTFGRATGDGESMLGRFGQDGMDSMLGRQTGGGGGKPPGGPPKKPGKILKFPTEPNISAERAMGVAKRVDDLIEDEISAISKASKSTSPRFTAKINNMVEESLLKKAGTILEFPVPGGVSVKPTSPDGVGGIDAGKGAIGEDGKVIDFNPKNAAADAAESGGFWSKLKNTAKSGWDEGLESSKWLKFINTTRVGGFLGGAEHILSTPGRLAFGVGKWAVKTGFSAIKDAGSSLISGAKKVPGVRKIVEAIESALSNSKILGMLKGTAASALSSNAGKIASEIGAKFAGSAMVKAVGKIAAKIAAWPITLAMFVYDFGSGMSSAGEFFGVSDDTVTWGMRAAAGAAKGISGICLGLIPISWLANMIYSFVATDEDQEALAASQADFDAGFQKAQEDDPSLTKEEYTKQQNPAWYTKAWNGIKSGASSLWEGTKWVAGKAWDGMKWAGGKIADGAKWAGGKIVSGAKWLGGKAADLGGKLWNGAKWAGGKVADFLFGDTVAQADEINASNQSFDDWKKTHPDGTEEDYNNEREQILQQQEERRNNKGIFAKIGGGIKSGAQWIGEKAKDIGGKVWDGAKSVGSWIGEKASGVGSWIGDKASGAVAGVSSAATKVKDTAVELAGDSWNWMKEKGNYIAGKLGDFWDWLGDKVKPAYEWIKDKFTWIKEKFGDLYGWFRDKILTSWTWVKGKLQDFWNWLGSTLKPVYDYIKDKVNWLKEKVFAMYDWICDKITPVANWIHDKVKAFWEWTQQNIYPKIQWVGDRIGDFINWMGDHISPVIGWIHDKVKSFWDWTKENVYPKIAWVGEKVGDLITWIGNNISPVLSWIYDKVKSFFEWAGAKIEPVLGWINDKVSAVWTWLSDTFGGVMSWIKEKMSDLADFVSPVGELFDWLKSKFTDSWLGKVFGGGDRGGSGGRGSSDEVPNKDKVVNGYQYYNQRDPRWATMPFGMYYGKQDTLGDGGCGPTVAAMAISKVASTEVSPSLMGKLALNGGFKLDDNGTTPKFFQAAGSQYGVQFTDLENSAKDLVTELRKGRPVVIMGQNTRGGDVPFGTAGPHYVLATGIDGNGNISILDPMNQKNNRKYPGRDIALNSMKYIAAKKNGGIDTNLYTKLAVDNRRELQAQGILPYGKGFSVYDAISSIDKMSKTFDGIFKSSFLGYSLDDVFTKMSNALTGTPNEEGGDDVTSSPDPSGGTALTGNVSQSDFIKGILPGAKTTFEKYRVVPSITLAQAALESGWGQSNVARTDKNLFGIKYAGGKGAPGIQIFPGTLCPAGESGGAVPYRRYNSWNDSVEDHGYFLVSNSRYGQSGFFNNLNYVSQANALQRAGYAEDPSYSSSLISMIKQYGFDEADNGGTPPLAGSGGRGVAKALASAKQTYGRIMETNKSGVSTKGVIRPVVASIKNSSPGKAVGRAIQAITNRNNNTNTSVINNVSKAIQSSGAGSNDASTAVTIGLLKILEGIATSINTSNELLANLVTGVADISSSVKSNTGGSTNIIAARGDSSAPSSSGTSLYGGGDTPTKYSVMESIAGGPNY